MAIGERIRFFRTMRGMTQKYLGMLMGFPEKSADIRMAQYETGSRTPKTELTKALANALEVSPLALNVPNIDNYLGVMHTLFTMEDLYGLTIENRDGEVLFRIDPRKSRDAMHISELVCGWAQEAEEYRAGKISKDQYDDWRYNYPKHVKGTIIWAEVPSEELSDDLVDALKNDTEE